MRILRIVGLVMALASFSAAQTGTSSITGSVTDITAAAIPGVDITLINPETGTRLQTISRGTGVYRFGSLPPGTYRIEAELGGFAPLSRGPLTLQVSQTLAIDLILQVGQVGETVEVTEAAPLIESQTSDIGQAVTRQ